MMKIIIGSVSAGVLAGLYLLPKSWLGITDSILVLGLCVLLFFVGIDIGMEGKALKNIKSVGIKILVFPLATILGTYVGAVVSTWFLPISALEALTVSSGFGWYSLAPVMIAEKSARLSAISFLHNVFREILGIVAIPFVAKYVGYIETTSLPGAAAMDVCLPIVEKSTSSTIAIYSFVSGLTLSIAVPIMVGLFLQFI